MQAFRSTLRGNPLQPAPERLVAARPLEQTSRQRAVIKARPPDQDRQPAATRDIPNHRGRLTCVAGSGVFLRGFDDVDHVVGNAALFVWRNLVGSDVEAAIDGRRIAADDFAVEPLGQRDAEGTLPRRRRTDDGDQARARAHFKRTPANTYRASAVSARNQPTCCARVGVFTAIRLEAFR